MLIVLAEAVHTFSDWQDRLRLAANHRDNWGLVQLVCLSTDEQLREWLVGADR
ncbi:hypothetical protein [Nocardia lasii]|uniref:Uncharacterized protein n=1 Tax=Nocardia lasii TaxID=1616107 RepID=A0ABW1JLJ8_9NOCA